MNIDKSSDSINRLAAQAAAAADGAIHATQRATNTALDALSDGVHDMHSIAAPLITRSGEQVRAMAQRGADAVRDTTQLVRDKAVHASDATVGYIKDEPVKAMLIAAATGAALMALIGLMTSTRRND